MNHLFFLPFDHRGSFAKKLLGFPYPLETAAQRNKMISMKRVVFDAALLARKKMPDTNELAILVDEEFDGDVLTEAKKKNIITAMTTEKSGVEVFEFQYGNNFGEVLKKRMPAYAKVLIRYNNKDKENNIVQNNRLKKLSEWCRKNNIKFLLEVLLSGKETRLTQMKRMIKSLEEAGVKPHVWKLEGLDKASDWKQIRKLTTADIVILGRGESNAVVKEWILEAAKSGVVRGFAVGRTVFLRPLEEYRDKKITKKEATEKISKNFLSYTRIFEKHLP